MRAFGEPIKNDTIDGKGGSDLMRDLYGTDDTFVFNMGYGQPNITDNGGNDTVLSVREFHHRV